MGANYKFLWVDIGTQGSASDCQIYNDPKLKLDWLGYAHFCKARVESKLNALDVRWEIIQRSFTFVSLSPLLVSLSILVRYELCLGSFRILFLLVMSSLHEFFCQGFQRMFAY